MKNPIFRIENLKYSKKNNILLNIKNFEIHRGACYMVSGGMCSGKTLLLNILTKNTKKFKGEVLYDNLKLSTMSKKKLLNDISFVKQEEKRCYFKTVEKYIKDEISKKHNDSTLKKKFNHIVTVMDIKYLLNEKIRNLSPGQFRWINLAAKISSYPKILIIDEIEQHLSKKNIECLSKILYRKCNYDGVTLIITSQNADYFRNIISVNVTLNQGRITRLRSFSNKAKRK